MKRTLSTGICVATAIVLRLAAQQTDSALATPSIAPVCMVTSTRRAAAAFRPGQGGDFAVAVSEAADGGRYLVVQDDGRVHELADYSGKPDLSCYSVTEADRLNANIARSDTMNGRVVAEWDGAVVCGFIEPTIAVCWQFAQEQRRFVRIGGWTT